MIVLVEYGSNGCRLTVWENVNWMDFHSDRKHHHQRQLSILDRFSEPER